MRGDKPSERRSVDFWRQELNATHKRIKPQIDRYIRYCRWYRGDMSDAIDPDATSNIDFAWQHSLDNLHTFVTDAAIAQLFFRNPRFVVRCPGGISRGVFTPKLAQVETMHLNVVMEKVGYFRKARRRLLDARLGPYGILKWSYTPDMVVDYEAIEDARAQATLENQNWLNFGKKMDAREDQLHSIHIDEHQALVASAERGEIQLPKAALKYLRKHIAVHEAMRKSERPTEVAKDAEIRCQRVNPLNFFYDATVEDIDDARWFCHSYLMRRVDAQADKRFSKKAREELATVTDRYERSGVNMFSAAGLTTGSFDSADDLVLMNEVFDRVDGTIREFFEGGTAMADEREFTLRDIQPNGPYSILMFKPDPMEAVGLPPPIAWESEQFAATALQSAVIASGIEGSYARGIYKKGVIDDETIERIRHERNGAWVPVDLPPDVKLSDVMGDAPTVEVSLQTLALRNDVRGRLQQSSGLGGGRALSGDQGAETATEAAISAGAAEAIAEDQAAILDDASSFDARMVTRLVRLCYPKRKIVEVVGDIALEAYPEREQWAVEDIVNDRNVGIIPGSSRRRSTSVDSKLTSELLLGMAGLPAYQGPAGMRLVNEGFRRIAEDYGLSGLPFDEVEQEQMMMAMMAQMGAQGPEGEEGEGEGGEEGGGGEGGPTEEDKRRSEQTEPSLAGQLQGLANTGGGRIATGAGARNAPRLLRGEGGVR